MDYISIINDDVDLTKQQRYLRLPHPRTGQPQLYLPYVPTSGSSKVCETVKKGEDHSILEVVKMNGSQRRTWFIGDSGIDAGSILVHYPIDPLFLVIPLILALATASNNQFQPLSDILTDLPSHPNFALSPPFTGPSASTSNSASTLNGGTISHNADLAFLVGLRSVRRVIKACCEKKVIPSSSASNPKDVQRYYRPSLPLAIKILQRKIDFIASTEQFEQFDHFVRSLGRDGLLGEGDQLSELRRLARTKAACEHVGQWLHPSVLKQLNSSYDFTPLLAHLADRNAAAIAASQIPTGSKSGASGDKDPKGTKRKAPASRGVEALKKVNTNNMAKLTSFFRPKEEKEKDKTKEKDTEKPSKKKK